MTKKSKILVLYISVFVFVLSLLILGFISNELHIQKIILLSNLFDMSRKSYVFDLNNLDSDRYHVVLRLYKEKNIDYFGTTGTQIKSKYPFEMQLELADVENGSTERQLVTQDSKIPYAFARDYNEMKLLSFNAKKGKSYKLKISFDGENTFYQKYIKSANQLYIEEDHDRASAPWLKLMQIVFLVTVMFTLLISLIILVNLYLRRRME